MLRKLKFGLLILWLVVHSSKAFITRTRHTGVASGSASYQAITENAVYLATAKLFNSMGGEATIPVSTVVLPETMFDFFYGKKVSTTDYIKAVDEIQRANVAIDFGRDTVDAPSWHFDDEAFHESNAILKRLWDTIYKSAMTGDYSQARSLSGQYLHVLQSFYSHSNWVEMGMTSPNEALGVEGGSSIGTVADAATVTCSACEIISSSSPKSYFCERNILSNINDHRILTSGYHTVKKNGMVINPKPSGKCGHGGSRDDNQDRNPVGGINKDSNSPDLSPHHYLHLEASRLAQQASTQFFERLLKAIRNEKFAQFLNIGVTSTAQPASRSLTIVMDTTGSMGPYIDAAKQRCLEIVELSQSSSNNPKNFVLVPFNDPDFGPALRTTDPEKFKANISALYAGYMGSGGDEAELCFNGILLASQQSEMGSSIFVFTDASTKNKELYPTIAATVTQKKQPVFFIGLPRPNVDPLYNSLAELSGGRIMVTSTDVSNIFDTTAVITSQIKGGTVLLVNARGVMDLSKTFEVAVDPLLEAFEVSVGHNVRAPSLQLFSPTGAAVVSVPVINTATTKSYKVEAPVSGMWRIAVSATQPDWYMEVSGQSALDVLCNFEYASDDIARYRGYYELINNPLMGENLLFVARSTRTAFKPQQARLLSASGNTIQAFPLHHGKITQDFTANFTMPTVPLYAEVRGTDENGNPFQRLQPTQIAPTQIRLSFFSGDSAVDEMLVGSSMRITFSVKNEGQTDQFQLTVSDTLGLITDYQPRDFLIAANTTVDAFVLINVPSTATPGSLSDVVMSVSLYGGSSRYNSNFFRKSITIIAPNPDIYPPECRVGSSNFETVCQDTALEVSKCASRKWSAVLHFNEKGSGVEGIYMKTSGSGDVEWSLRPLESSSTGNTSITGTMSGSCCTELVTFTVIDKSGLTGSCVLERPEEAMTINLRDIATGSSGTQIFPVPVSVTVPPGKSRTLCVDVKVDEKATIKIQAKNGAAKVYISFEVKNPGPPPKKSSLRIDLTAGKSVNIETRSTVKSFAPTAVGTAKMCMSFYRQITTRMAGFEADSDATFDVTAVKGIIKSCGGNISIPFATQAVEISGPGFFSDVALGYSGGLECQWKIIGPVGHYLEIKVPFIKLMSTDELNVGRNTGAVGSCYASDEFSILSSNRNAAVIRGKSSNRLELSTSDNLAIITLKTYCDAPVGYGINMLVTALLQRDDTSDYYS